MNTNVLAGIRCPHCKSEGPFNVWGEALFLDVTDDGVSEFQDFQWGDESTIHCLGCGYHDKALAFTEGK